MAILDEAPAGQHMAMAEEFVEIVDRGNYHLVYDWLARPGLPVDLRDFLMADLAQQDSDVKLPYLLALARDGEQWVASDAHEYLVLFLDQDLGTNWEAWSQAISPRG